MIEYSSDSRLFIVGFPRSGTTLLQRMLDAHPAIAVAPETQFMVRIWQQRAEFGDTTLDENWDVLLDAATQLPRFHEANYSADEFRMYAQGLPRSYAHLFDGLMHFLADPAAGQLLGEKSPDHIRYIPQIAEWFPNAKFVHIVRDPRAALNSLIGLPWADGGYRENAYRWRARMQSLRRLPPELRNRTTTIRYEDLVDKPAHTLRAVCSFLSVPYDDAMLSYHKQEMSYYEPESKYWMRNTTLPVFTSSVDRWRDELSQSHVQTIESVAWREMARKDYQTSLPPLQLSGAIVRESARYNVERIRYYGGRLVKSQERPD